MKKTVFLFIVIAIFLFNTCALEIANVIGPGGGYVFDDKGNYKGGWRYIQCAKSDFGEISNIDTKSIIKAIELCEKNSDDFFTFDWELPNEDQIKKMLECFSYGLTGFSPDVYYLAINTTEDFPGTQNPSPDPEKKLRYKGTTWEVDESTWTAVVYHKNFDKAANGVVEKIKKEDIDGLDDKNLAIQVRAVRRF
jgi:hypothetical protein